MQAASRLVAHYCNVAKYSTRVNKGNNSKVPKALSSAEPTRRLKRKTIVMSSSSNRSDFRLGVSDAVAEAEAETRAVTLTEPLRVSRMAAKKMTLTKIVTTKRACN